jgi:hypothetical protein
MAEIEWRKAGNRLDGMMAVTHYAAMYYPARVLGDGNRACGSTRRSSSPTAVFRLMSSPSTRT